MSLTIEIISGFLGAGKTTLIKKLLDETLDERLTVVIENEFGDVNIDGDLVRQGSLEVREITSGCICCSLRGNFLEALEEMEARFQPDRIIIEPSGVGKLSDVYRAVQEYCEKSRQGTVHLLLTVVDARKFFLYLDNFSDFYQDQLVHAQTILLSRSQLMDHNTLEQIQSTIHKLNPQAQVVTSSWDRFHTEELYMPIGQSEQGVKNELYSTGEETGARGENMTTPSSLQAGKECPDKSGDSAKELSELLKMARGDTSISPRSLETWSIETSRCFTKEELKNILSHLDNNSDLGQIVRSKGIVQETEQDWLLFDYVPDEQNIRQVSASHTGRIVVIGENLKPEQLIRLFEKPQ